MSNIPSRSATPPPTRSMWRHPLPACRSHNLQEWLLHAEHKLKEAPRMRCRAHISSQPGPRSGMHVDSVSEPTLIRYNRSYIVLSQSLLTEIFSSQRRNSLQYCTQYHIHCTPTQSRIIQICLPARPPGQCKSGGQVSRGSIKSLRTVHGPSPHAVHHTTRRCPLHTDCRALGATKVERRGSMLPAKVAFFRSASSAIRLDPPLRMRPERARGPRRGAAHHCPL
jgi:hypothetical protein